MRLERIDAIFNFEKGTLQSTKCEAGQFDFITASKEWKSHSTFTHEKEALVIAVAASGSLGRTHYVNGKFIASDLCFILTPKSEYEKTISLAFYHFVFNGLKEDIVKRCATGTAKQAINQQNFASYRIPYFEPVEQDRMALRLKAAFESQESLDTEIDHQQALLTKLKQAILQEAIQGKLTADWRATHPKVEPADHLLRRIKAGKARLIATKKLRPEKPLPEITQAEIPFEIPKDWAWCRIGDVCKISSGKGFEKNEYSESGVRLFQIANVSIGETSWDTTVRVPSSYLAAHPDLQLQSGDLVMALNRPLLGRKLKVAILSELDVPAVLYQRVGRFDMFERSLIPWLFAYLTSDCFSGWLYDQIKGVNIPFVNQSKVHTHLFPLPPLAEQAAIVERVEALMTTCRALEAEIEHARTHATQLLQTVLKEAFAS